METASQPTGWLVTKGADKELQDRGDQRGTIYKGNKYKPLQNE